MITDRGDNTCNITRAGLAGMLMRNDTAKSLLKQGNTIPGKHNPRENTNPGKTQTQDQPGLETTACKCWLFTVVEFLCCGISLGAAFSSPPLGTQFCILRQRVGTCTKKKTPPQMFFFFFLVQILSLPCKTNSSSKIKGS